MDPNVVMIVGSYVGDGVEVVDLAGFGGEAGGGGQLGETPKARLPLDADAMVAGIDREIEVGIAAVGADPFAVETNTDRDIADVDAGAAEKIIEDVDHGFAGRGLGGGVLIFVGLDVEFNVTRAASGGAGKSSGVLIVLGVGGECCRDGKKKSGDEELRDG